MTSSEMGVVAVIQVFRKSFSDFDSIQVSAKSELEPSLPPSLVQLLVASSYVTQSLSSGNRQSA
jgi:hypothetical protein